MTAPPDILVIGYGNELRTDDGSGPQIAAAIEQLRLPRVRVITAHQLTPELAEQISAAGAVVFIDAAVGTHSEIQIQPVADSPASGVRGHVCEPPVLLELAQRLFGHSPRAWLITVPAFNLSFGQSLTPRARSNVSIAVNRFLELRTRIAAVE